MHAFRFSTRSSTKCCLFINTQNVLLVYCTFCLSFWLMKLLCGAESQFKYICSSPTRFPQTQTKHTHRLSNTSERTCSHHYLSRISVPCLHAFSVGNKINASIMMSVSGGARERARVRKIVYVTVVRLCRFNFQCITKPKPATNFSANECWVSRCFFSRSLNFVFAFRCFDRFVYGRCGLELLQTLWVSDNTTHFILWHGGHKC